MTRYSWTQPQCEACWYHENPDREPFRIIPDETEEAEEICVSCGLATNYPIWIRVNPLEAQFPTREKE